MKTRKSESRAPHGGGDVRSATIASIPTTLPSSPLRSSATKGAGGTTVDPNVILDSIDSYGTRSIAAAAVNEQQKSNSNNFDPIDFLNHHFLTESTLVSALPALRSSIHERTAMLSDSISSSIQKQSDLADSTATDVARAKTAILALHDRVTLVQSKALQSERAVLEITRDMKRLDYAKRHLQRTITALKRLHMLLHAAEQLRLSAVAEPYPDYKSAANLVDATRLLLGHFDGYMGSIRKMRLLRDAVGNIGEDLRRGIVKGFHDVGFEDATDEEGENNDKTNIMTTDVLADACLVIDALGLSVRDDFVQSFCKEHLAPYSQLFGPVPAPTPPTPTTPTKPSFKIRIPSDATSETQDNDSTASTITGEPSSLDQIERRYAWFRNTLRTLHSKFNYVFPTHWTLHYKLSKSFLLITGDHLKILLKKGGDGDRENVTVLLKALQKTILFEKEMMACLQRDYDTIFLENNKKKKRGGDDIGASGRGGGIADVSNMGDIDDALIGEEDGSGLEFDEDGKAVAASSAQGIKIKYERKMKQNKASRRGNVANENDQHPSMLERKDEEVKPVPSLLGVASSVFDPHMGPYIALEEQNMEEQLSESRKDDTVDTRGELPVFTSSTALFVYIKNSITRCTVLTQGKTFYSLYGAFKETLKKYAAVLEDKFPQALNLANMSAIGGININVNVSSLPSTFGGSSSRESSSGGAVSAVYRIPPGEEVTVCHVIDTCEYCADTVEALEDLIRDKINDEFKRKIDMSSEQEVFHDVTARGIRVLVSGLEQRTEPAFKEMSSKNWGSLDVVGEESAYVRSMHDAIQPFVLTVQGLIPSSYFRNFCDRFAAAFTSSYYNTIIRQKRISESGTQQLLLDVYNLKTLLLKLPVIEKSKSSTDDNSGSPPRGTPGSRIPPAMYTKMVTKQFAKIELLLKLVGTPPELLIDVFKAQWDGGSALNLQTVMNLKGMNRKEQTTMLEKFGLDSETAQRGAAAGSTSSTVTEHVQILQEKSSDVAANLSQMRQKVDDFRKAFR